MLHPEFQKNGQGASGREDRPNSVFSFLRREILDTNSSTKSAQFFAHLVAILLDVGQRRQTQVVIDIE